MTLSGPPGNMLRIFSALLAVKLLLVPAYRSTDFEVHRNWMAITHSLKLDRWYIEDTSKWTLDYPPLFAWVEWLLAKVANLVEPSMLDVSEEPYDSFNTLVFQRLTVIALELVLISAAYKAVRKLPASKSTAFFALAVGNVGLIFVDNIHFQYNGMLLGLLMWSIMAIEDGHNVLGGVIFATLVNMKHLFIFAGPVYFVYLLRNYCWGPRFLWKLSKLGFAIIFVFILSFGPFIWMEQLYQVFNRLFPFGRGLLHAYWAPNAWALYAFLDKVLAMGCRHLGFTIDLEANLTGGLVEDAGFLLLPRISPLFSLFLTLLFISPSLILLWNHPKPQFFLESVAYANFCGFVWGFHVHEKAILTVLVPLAFSAAHPHLFPVHPKDLLHFFTVALYSLFPLLFTAQEYPIKLCLLLIQILTTYIVVMPEQRVRLSRIRKRKWEHFVCQMHLWGLLGVEVYSLIIHNWLWGGSLPFLPLMLISVYCSLGICWYWSKVCFGMIGYCYESPKLD